MPGFERLTVDCGRFQTVPMKVNQKGRPPANEREALAARCAKITGTKCARWLRCSERAMTMALAQYERDGVPEGVRNPAAWFTWLITKKYA